ncbi:MAG: hypothetical protein WC623_18785 [Pedobacter sp.]|uniref:hypothetical protein n=1 Tax=Pedobacter sp. TaxID=1411316 RepID=UPI0035619959
MFKQKPGDKILIVFSDPGGAKPCLAIADEIDPSGLLVISDREYSFYTDFRSKVTIINSDLELEKIIDDFKPNLIFTGTSYTSNIEKTTILLAKRRGIHIKSFVDHWTSISNRFRDDKGNLNLPNDIWVLDERARLIAVDEGISSESLYISGNPYHMWLKNWKPKITRELFFKNIGLDTEKRIILFAPDPLSNVNGLDTYGFDELSASIKLVNCVNDSSVEFRDATQILVKMHPNQVVKELENIFFGQANFTILPPEINTNESIYFSDIVVGFFSSILIEADLMDKPVVRFFEKDSKNDPLIDQDLGIKTNEDNLIIDILKKLSIK